MKQAKSKNGNGMSDETLDDSRRLANTDRTIDKGRECIGSFDHRHPTDTDL